MSKKKLLQETAKLEKVITQFKTHSITKTNQFFYVGAVVVTIRLGVNICYGSWEKGTNAEEKVAE